MWPEKVKAGVGVFVGLHAGEQRAEHDRQPQAVDQALAVAVQQRVVRPGHRGAGGEQDQRVEQRQMPGIEGAAELDAVGLGAGGQTLPIRSPRSKLVRRRRGTARVEIGPEPGDEEHHLGGDEQDHAVAVRNLHHAGVIAVVLAPR